MRKNFRSRKGKEGRKDKQLEHQKLSAQTLPPVISQLSTGITLRFVTQAPFAAAGGAITVTFQNLLDAWLIAGQPAAGYQLFDFVKIRRVTIRGGAQIGGGGATQVPSCTVGVEYPGLVTGFTGSGRQKSDTSMTPFVPAMVSMAPGKDTLAGMWQQSSANAAFVVRCSDQGGNGLLGAIIDVDLSYKNSADVNPAAVASAIAGATAGEIYFGGLDGGRLAATTARSAFLPRI